MNFEKIKFYVKKGLWNEKMCKIAVKKGIITQEQYENIINDIPIDSAQAELNNLMDLLADAEEAMIEGVESIE